MEGIDPAEVGLVALAIIVIGVVISLIMVSFSRRHERRRHKRVSNSRRNAATQYDIVGGGEAGSASGGEATSSRRGYRRPRPTIDIITPSDTPK